MLETIKMSTKKELCLIYKWYLQNVLTYHIYI